MSRNNNNNKMKKCKKIKKIKLILTLNLKNNIFLMSTILIISSFQRENINQVRPQW